MGCAYKKVAIGGTPPPDANGCGVPLTTTERVCSMKLGGKAEQNKKEKKVALLSAAFDLFTKQGINKTSIADISSKAKVAKGTFYLYFSDKYDLRNFLVAHRAGQIFLTAKAAVEKDKTLVSVEDKIVALISNVIDQFTADPSLVRFISKNLSWGIFKHDLTSSVDPEAIDYSALVNGALDGSDVKYRDPEVMIFMIVELIGSTCYSAILFKEPKSIQELKPDLLQAVRDIMHSQQIKD